MKIRKAVGAVVFQNEEYLLVHKVKSISDKSKIVDHWDFPKGGIEISDTNLEDAVLRELKEETGSNNYKVINIFEKKICFNFPKGHKYDKQETIMFYVEYLGNRKELKPRDQEISEVKFVNRDELMESITLEETLEFLNEVIL